MSTTTYSVTTSHATTQVNTSTAGEQYGQQMVSRADGSSVVFYASGTNLLARVVGTNGVPTGSEITVSTAFSGGFDHTISATTLTNGNIVVTWASNGATPDMMFSIYNSSMGLISGPTVGEASGAAAAHPDVAALAGGGFVIAWEKNFGATDHDVAFRRFDSAGNSVDTSTGISFDTTGAYDEFPSVAVLNDGKIVIGFDRLDTTTGNTGLWRMIANADGTQNLAPTAFDNTGTYNTRADVIALSGGGFSINYADNGWGNQDITSALFNSAGTFQSYTHTGSGTGAEYAPTSARSSGGFVFVASQDLTTSSHTSGALLAADGTLLLNNITVASFFSGEGAVNWTDGAHVRIASNVLSPNPANDGAGNGVAVTDMEVRRTITGDATGETLAGLNDGLLHTINGNDGNDTISGFGRLNTYNGGLGDDTITSAGNDNIDGGDGNDTVFAGSSTVINGVYYEVLNGGAGTDLLDTTSFNGTYTINLDTGSTNFAGESFTNFENVRVGNGNTTVLGTAVANDMTGGGGTDYLIGYGGNDTLRGGGVAVAGQGNTLQGGIGDDNYYVSVREDSTLEFLNEGFDTVYTTFNIYGLQNNVERLVYTDAANHGAGVGNTLDNYLYGNTGVDDLFGREGNDVLLGGTGAANTLLGQTGDDVYYSQAAGDSVIEFAGEGNDWVYAYTSSFVLRPNVENLLNAGGTNNFVGVGSDESNQIAGGSQIDFLNGLGGNDFITGGNGNDELQGGTGADQFRYSAGQTGLDRILDFVGGTDKIALNGYAHTATVDFISTGAPAPTSTNSTFMYNVNNGIVSYDADGTGAGAAVQLAQLNAGLVLSGGDFIFY